jgi:hypothetical protein
MKLRFEIEYPWAKFNNTETLIHIRNAQKSTDHTFKCPECDSEFVACQGVTNQWYFKHKNSLAQLNCTTRDILSNMQDYFEKYYKFPTIITNFVSNYPDFTTYTIINRVLYPLVNEKLKIIVDFLDFRGIKALDHRVENANLHGYDTLLVTAYHRPVEKLISSSHNTFIPFKVMEFQTQLFPELFTSMKEHAGVFTINENIEIEGWKQHNNPKYFSQVTNIPDTFILNYLKGV